MAFDICKQTVFQQHFTFLHMISLLSHFFHALLVPAPMKAPNSVSPMAVSTRRRLFLFSFLPTVFLVSAAFFIGSAFAITDYRERFSRWVPLKAVKITKSKICEAQCRPDGSEALPKGIVSRTSNLEMRPLWGPRDRKKNSKSSMNLLAIAAGIKQKESVNKIVQKFLLSDFVVMLFHYDGIVDDWKDLEWISQAIHVSAINQTKWWFAKRFLHPDIVSEYAYIFLWDEDLGVENFHVGRYLSIIKEEGLVISQPALDPDKSEVHHLLTARDKASRVHRRTYRTIGVVKCDENSTDPPCTGWVEMMAPVFSQASWHCVWHMIQNDLIHAWGLDRQFGYCAKGNRTKNIGIVDSEYIVHYALPTLGGSTENRRNPKALEQIAKSTSSPNSNLPASSVSTSINIRYEVRKQSSTEQEIFKNRWKKAVREDQCWIDPYQQPARQSNS